MIRLSFLFHFSLLYMASMVAVFNYKIWKSYSIEIKFLSNLFTWTSLYPTSVSTFIYLYSTTCMYGLLMTHEVILKTNQSTAITYIANLWPMNCWTRSLFISLIPFHRFITIVCKPIPPPGGRVLNKFLYGEAPPRGPTLYSFIYQFSPNKYPFRIPSIDKWYPF